MNANYGGNCIRTFEGEDVIFIEIPTTPVAYNQVACDAFDALHEEGKRLYALWRDSPSDELNQAIDRLQSITWALTAFSHLGSRNAFSYAPEATA